MAFVLAKIRVTGKVQGVGYRFYTERMANLLKITGWVKNNYDNTVDIEAVGSKNNIDEFILTLKSGPSLAKVETIDYKFENVDYNDYDSFNIIHEG